MSAPVLDIPIYEFEVNAHTYRVRFRDNMHAHILYGEGDMALVLYLKRFIPESLHVMFLKRIMYVRKEFAI